MDIFQEADYKTPSRTILQEEERQSLKSSQYNLWVPPVIMKHNINGEKPLECDLLVVSCTPCSCALVRGALDQLEMVGTLIPVLGNKLEENTFDESVDKSCAFYALPSTDVSQLVDGPPSLIFNFPLDIPPEQTHAIALAIFNAVKPQQVIILGSMTSDHYYGPNDASQSCIIHLLQTRFSTSCKVLEKRGPVSELFSLLPPGNVVSGLEGAILSRCQINKIACNLLLYVEMVARLRSHALKNIVAALVSVAGNSILVSKLAQPESTQKAKRILEAETKESFIYS
uniref:Proteasome assembly chaperone 1 n=1 Tax=Polytomella parva TaxID=51329 RepID=A0A7S0YUR0_9CHLO|mmetsp:Transcript_9855/g.18398  ORF Transcript_9855/g.18398 Transcript_9855/m.18398 type:complete len:285 (+) Transcript_9855:125-979(+)|eukprot:CAMPEP_0175045588 /NCGR_PEP_ID=MMETSP0052_2-20121109/4516_1 /TAXON_ID=51329 ORGANISM="Polytomella parva, Strain SAG 63-3" /NCGR_SAMPLE_ID=MMETSP0052_2 /ASSEMBLY_ACC=CAM_ASM_000194 /LENGTH=284 /DNA_ID=CAMNT_0016309155 /DNA_START=92 /DNA_END=946 /DNA_ORIENTATION=-